MALNYNLDTAISQIASMLQTDTGVTFVTDFSESFADYPVGIVFPLSGEETFIARGATHGEHTVACLFYLTDQVLMSSYNTARGYIDTVRESWFNSTDATYSDNVFVATELSYSGPAGLSLGDATLFGIRFELTFTLAN